jgi:hypothetical protein
MASSTVKLLLPEVGYKQQPKHVGVLFYSAIGANSL